MSKYTTEVRFICENKSGLEESVGASNVDDVISNSWNKIFTSKVTFFDEEYRSVLCQKILKHYYLREICCETVGIWLLWMNERLEMIMPYYNQLYESAKLKFEPLNDVNITRKHDTEINGTEERNGETSDTTNGTRENINNGTRNVTGTNDTKDTDSTEDVTNSNSSENKKDLYSDTPQGAITNLENESYLTNARKITDSVTNDANSTSNSTRNIDNDYTESDTTTNNENMVSKETKNGTNKVTGSSNTTESYIETLVGKQSSGSYSKMLMEFRDTFLNIDLMVIDEFKDLFFGLW